uniref:Uncharacterized protein n=1 Tax=Arundo donax TaxID=35708 RepID=A0A0A9BA88_ARUDO
MVSTQLQVQASQL